MSDDILVEHMPARDLAALLRVSLALAQSRDIEAVLQSAIGCTVDALQMDTGAIYFCNAEGRFWLGVAYPPPNPSPGAAVVKPAIENVPHLRRAMELGEPHFVRDVLAGDPDALERQIAEKNGLRSMCFIPLTLDSGCYGVLIVGSRTPIRRFSSARMALCRVLAVQIAFAISNARLLEAARIAAAEIACAYDATLEGWSLALDMRDSETLGHTERAARLTVDVAEALGMSDEDLLRIRRGALLHDIGKLGVPDAILNKPGALTDDEWVIMRQHPVHARDFLARIDYLGEAIDIPYSHHERWDGSGYPQGLSGEDIPLGARVFAVVDVYDALTSDRPYRKAWDPNEAKRYLSDQAGAHFDPRVVDVFLQRMNGGIRH